MKIACPHSLVTYAHQWVPEPDLHPCQGAGNTLEMLSDAEAVIVPLETLPVTQEGDSWTIAALSPRFFSKINILGNHWEKRLFWLPEKAGLWCFDDSITQQVRQVRMDIQWMTKQKADFHIDSWWQPEGSEAREIDPGELTPPSGYGVLALITLKKNTSVRKWAQRHHNISTMQCTNVERQWQHDLENRNERGCGIVVKDGGHRFTFYFCVLRRGEIYRSSITQDSWVGLYSAALRQSSYHVSQG